MAHYVLDTNRFNGSQTADPRRNQPASAARSVDVEARQQIAALVRQQAGFAANQAKMAEAINGTDAEFKAFVAEVGKAFKQLQAMIAQLAASAPSPAVAVPPSEEVVDVNGTPVEDAFTAPDVDDGAP